MEVYRLYFVPIFSGISLVFSIVALWRTLSFHKRLATGAFSIAWLMEQFERRLDNSRTMGTTPDQSTQLAEDFHHFVHSTVVQLIGLSREFGYMWVAKTADAGKRTWLAILEPRPAWPCRLASCLASLFRRRAS